MAYLPSYSKILYYFFIVSKTAAGIVISPYAKDKSDLPRVSISDYFFGKLRSNLSQLENVDWVVDVATGVSVKFSEIDDKSRRIASALVRRGFKKGDVLYYVTYETAVLYLVHVAVWRLGGAVRGCYQQDDSAEYARQLRETRSRFLLVDSDTNTLLRQAVQELEWNIDFLSIGKVTVPDSTSVEQLLQDDGTVCPDHVEVDVYEDVVMIPNTSGSTGKPKGVLHTHFTVVAALYNSASFAKLGGSFMTSMSNFAIGVLVVTLNSLCKGTTIYHLGSFQKPNYIDLLVKLKPSSALMYPFIATWFARSPLLDTLDLSFLKIIFIGGSVLDPSTTRLLQTRMPNSIISSKYAMTECIGIASTDIGNSSLKIIENEGETCVSSGKLTPYVQAKIVDENSGDILGPNKRGLIFVRGPCVMKGYLISGNEVNRSCIDKDGWFSTGDIGFFDEDGNMYIKERRNCIFKYYMHFVSPSEIESVLLEHDAVQAAGVVGIPNPETTNIARGFVVLRPGASATCQQLLDHVAARLPTYMHLHGGIAFVDKLPENKRGKMDRIALLKYAQEFENNENVK